MSERKFRLGNDGPSINLGINYPRGDLNPDLIAFIVKGSKTHPLRELIAHQIVTESRELWMQYKPQDYDQDPSPRSAQDIALNDGYYRAGQYVLLACEYLNDELSAVQLRLRPLQDYDRDLSAGVRKDTEREMQEGIESLTIDPSGMDWLKSRLKITQVVWGDMDPQTVGFEEGIKRYREIYLQARINGAAPDTKAVDRRAQMIAFLKRSIRQNLPKKNRSV